jgi:uncharacterized membrane protein YqjE
VSQGDSGNGAGKNGNGAGAPGDDLSDGIDGRLERSLSALAAAPVDAPPMSEDLARELEGLAPARTRSPRRQLGLVVGVSLLYGGVILALLGLRHDAEHLPRMWLVGGGTLWLASFGVISWMVVVPPRDQVMPRWRWAAALAALAAVLFVAGGILRPDTALQAGAASDLSLATWFDRGQRCLRWGLTVAVVPVVLSALFVRGAVPVGSRWTAAAIGAAGGSLGGLVLHLHCGVADRFHVGLAHGGVIIVAALIAALVAPVGERGRRPAAPSTRPASEQT